MVGREGTVPDVVAPGLDVLFCGINPSCISAATGHHFARPGNRFWPVLHLAGFTPRRLAPAEQFELLEHGLGLTNLASRGTVTAAELDRAELVDGGRTLAATARRYAPQYVAVVGVTAYRIAFARPRATIGPQPEPLGGARAWVLPNPSGLNAHYQLPDLVREYAALRAAVTGRVAGTEADTTTDAEAVRGSSGPTTA